ncbi:MAG: acylphosphatase [Hyphomicrobiales bacterium]|nr:acylphosphatase [Hyphomicrobiales bacterium]
MTDQRCVHVRITGRVQGVSFRAWTRGEARARNLSGWVRNRADGTVEAVFCGPPDAVNDMIKACHDGPRWANVTAVAVSDETQKPGGAFTILNER